MSTYIAHDISSFIAWLMQPTDDSVLRRVKIDIPNANVEDLCPFLSCDKWNYSVESIIGTTLTIRIEDPVSDDKMEEVQALFDEAASDLYVGIFEEDIIA